MVLKVIPIISKSIQITMDQTLPSRMTHFYVKEKCQYISASRMTFFLVEKLIFASSPQHLKTCARWGTLKMIILCFATPINWHMFCNITASATFKPLPSVTKGISQLHDFPNRKTCPAALVFSIELIIFLSIFSHNGQLELIVHTKLMPFSSDNH